MVEALPLPKPRIDRDVDMYAVALRNLQDVTGLPSREVLRIIGREFGGLLADRIKSDDVSEVVTYLNRAMESEELGHTDVESWEPIVLKVTNCLGCEREPDIEGGNASCPLREGILEAALSKKTGKSVKVRGFTYGKGVGGKTCEFKIDI